MSPQPASPPPTAPQGSLRQWGALSPSPTPPKSANSVPPPPPMPHQISEARAKLRSTGRTLDELDSSRDVYTGRVRNESYNYSQNTDSGPLFTPPLSPTSPTASYKTGYVNGRFQNSGSQDGNYLTNVGRSQSFQTSNIERIVSQGQHKNDYGVKSYQSRPRSPQPSAPPRQGRNKIFAGHFSTLQNPKKKSEQRFKNESWSREDENNLDDSFHTQFKKSDCAWQDQRNYSRLSSNRQNERPKSSLENDYGSRNTDYSKQGSTHFSAKMAGKFSEPRPSQKSNDMFAADGVTPVPPPRTKRRPRPQTTYYFGQPTQVASITKHRPNSFYANVSYNTSSATKDDYTDNKKYNYINTNKMNNKHKSTSLFSSQNGYQNDYSNNYNEKSSLKNGSDFQTLRYDDNAAMNRRNDRYNNHNYSNGQEYSSSRSNDRKGYSNERDYSNERYDSGFGERQETYGQQRDHYCSKGEDRSGRTSDVRRQDERKRYSRKSNKDEDKTSLVEGRYRTTKTITPVFVMERKQPKQYRSMDVLNTSPERNSSWTQTLESRRKDSDNNLRISSTLPRKVQHTTYSMPSKTYVYGINSNSDKIRTSMVNINRKNDYESPSIGLTNGNSSKHVLRSHSLNVRPVTNLSNLRSPNLIASIARTSSTRRPETQSSEDLLAKDSYEPTHSEFHFSRPISPPDGQEDDKKSRFMEGLLNTAPELFHFIHGDGEDTIDNRKNPDSPPKLVRPPGSSAHSPAPLNAPKVFTFGREGGNTLRRGSSGSGTDLNTSTSNLNKVGYSTNSMSRNSSGYDSGTYSTNSIKRTGSLAQDAANRRQSTFNMKTQGSSLLYSPSFRERSQQMLEKKQQMQRDAEMIGKRPATLENTPILIQVRDYNNSR